jgi:hypothetical protein
MIAVNNVKEPDVLVHFRKHRKSKRVTSSLTGLTFKQLEVLLPFFEEAKLKSQELCLQNKEIKRIQSGGKAGFLFSTYSLPARKSSLFIHGQSVDVVQEVANLFGKQRRRALGEVQFDAFQKQRFFSGKGVYTAIFLVYFTLKTT